ncbi:hypothetical protein ATE67_13310 [Sphingopyxis sp. H050]|jgi:spore germination cell wall hydrolase CwlJ-like protein|uniref:cell wall hydrolase n=1 Tax=Sphingopyxis sp. H050 TaxID=1759072 RepID=UPI000736FC46|nr:cell wall hydrolase [Sphingopyxis sp. H050]KTE19627.1 hypothetical protein ATE67_13310 [Sphingopyxis sp. H050]
MTVKSLPNRIVQIAASFAALFLLASFSSGTMSHRLTAQLDFQSRGEPVYRDLPDPEPLLFSDLDPQTARQINDAIPFSAGANPAARPFVFAGSETTREKAIDCMGAAMWYEAGNDDIGQRAVGQVVLNRVRHPAFPSSVCGVVFQGSERATGCQFTFTCDGALKHVPSEMAWAETRSRARAALAGFVYAPVGLATHYHTDWVHPVWSAKLEKLARVHTHLFFRWTGKWGQPAAMVQVYAAAEAPITKLARLSLAHRAALGEDQIRMAESGDAAADAGLPSPGIDAMLTSMQVPVAAPQSLEGVHFIDARAEGNGGTLAMRALGVCGAQKFCKVVGWREGSGRGGALPASNAEREAVAFLYIRDRRTGVDRAFWDCAHFERQNAAQCLGTDRARWIDFNGNFQSGSRPGAQIT